MNRGIRAVLRQSCSRRCFQSVAYNPFTINLFQPCAILLQQAAEQMAGFQRAPFKRTDMLELGFQAFPPAAVLGQRRRGMMPAAADRTRLPVLQLAG